MYCKNCGNVINPNDKTCLKCGTSVEVAPSVTPTPVETPNVPIVETQPVTPVVNNEPTVAPATPVVNNEPVVVPQVTNTPIQQPMPRIYAANTVPFKFKRKNPNTVLYIVLAVVILVAIVCLTLVIRQG